MQSAPVQDFFMERGLQHDFEITAGIPHTLPRLLHSLADVLEFGEQRAEQQASG
jgi:hypothetical protein